MLNFLGILSREMGEYSTAISEYAESRDLYKDLGDFRGEAHVCNNLGLTAIYEADMESAASCLWQGQSLIQKTGSKREAALLTGNLGYFHYLTRDFESSKRFLAESMATSVDLGDEWLLGSCHTLLARALICNGEGPQAADAAVEGLNLALRVGEATAICTGLDAAAEILANENKLVEAVRVRSAAESYRRAEGLATHSVEAAILRSELARARASIDETAFDQAWAQGQSSEIKDSISWAIELLNASTPRPDHRGSLEKPNTITK
jgi:tetratricopeptide (TPR) repeat protein